MNDIRLDSRKVTDDFGAPLRSNHFPYRLDRPSPPSSAGFAMRPRPVDKRLETTKKLAASMSNQSMPTTFMMVDYQQDRKQITAKLLMESIKANQRTLQIPQSVTDRQQGKKESPTKTRSTGRPPQPLRSSFLLPKRPSSEQDLSPVIMFNKEDKSLQYEPSLIRQDLSISAYQAWSTKVVEPFFKVCTTAVEATPLHFFEFLV